MKKEESIIILILYSILINQLSFIITCYNIYKICAIISLYVSIPNKLNKNSNLYFHLLSYYLNSNLFPSSNISVQFKFNSSSHISLSNLNIYEMLKGNKGILIFLVKKMKIGFVI